MTHDAKQSRLVVLVPYLWLVVFFLIPFGIVVKISLSQAVLSQPPYQPVFDIAAGLAGAIDYARQLSLDAYRLAVSDSIYATSFMRSLVVAVFSTILLLLTGFPIAYGIACAPRHWQRAMTLAVILPFWTSFLIRVYAWINILQHDGLLNRTLLTLRIVNEPVAWLASDTAIFIGIVYSYLPFMILPIYSALEKQDGSLLEAAADLGCPRWRAFWSVTVPVAAPGIAAGSLLCFIPIVGEFVIPDLLGGSESLMIGQTLWGEFFGNKDWPVASAIAVSLLLLLVVPMTIYETMQARAMRRGS